MDAATPQHESTSLRRYWLVFLPTAFVLALMVRFPLQIALEESFLDALYYGGIVLVCIAAAIRAHRRFSKRARRLIALILLCSLLSGWQVFDMVILRQEGPFASSFTYPLTPLEPLQEQWASYNVRFPNPAIVCHIRVERYFGNSILAITLEIKRDATYAVCGG
jgi:hypothetical protein